MPSALIAFALIVVTGDLASAAELHHRVSLVLGADLAIAPELGGHGFGLLRYDLDGLPHGSHFALELNSDTLRVAYDRMHLGRVELGVAAAGEVLIAGVLTDYYRNGHDDAGRGFWSSYISAGGYAKLNAAPHFLELGIGARRWFFQRREGTTRPELTLPPEAWVAELRLLYTLWLVRPDPSLFQPQRLHPRVRGFAFGVEAGLDTRSEIAPWGARDTSFAPIDPRNDPRPTIVMLRQWLRAGAQVHPRLRLQFDERASWMWGEDDLVRQRVGGLNPYSVPLAGAPWAGYLTGKLAAAEASLHVRVWHEIEVGALVDGAVLEDADRIGQRGRAAALAGLGAFADLRFASWQIDVRGGWSPTLVPGTSTGGWSVFAALGWAWTR